MKYIVSYSGGIGSFVAAAMCLDKYGSDNVDLVFCDTKIEDPDLYRFLEDSEKRLNKKITRLADGRTPWEVFRDVKFVGNSRLAHCSKILKRDMFEKYMLENHKLLPEPTATVVLGIDWTEIHRFEKAKKNWDPWPVIAPLCEPPLLSKHQVQNFFSAYGVAKPALYEKGFAHNNCGGFCVRAGQAQFVLLLQTNRELYLWHEEEERKTYEILGGQPHPFLRKIVDGVPQYLTMRQFRDAVESGCGFDKYDFGGCGCFVDDPNDKEAEPDVLSMFQ